ncbi:MAG: MBL fold metallo-hydrolase [Chloroflexaceae bacterium]|nr:MBL fold metallo-hydrolase [Chloroflexaceae bacterium]
MTSIDFSIEVDVPAQTNVDFYNSLLQNQPVHVLDVRNPDAFQRGTIEGKSNLTVQNLPYYDFVEDADAAVAQVSSDRDIVVVCAKAQSSQFVAGILQERGYRVSYLEGGMPSWGNFYDVRPLLEAPFGQIIQVARPARGDVSFVLVSDGQAAVIDPLRHLAYYRDAVAQANANITLILDTHAHADHISGGPALAAETDAPYYLHPYDAIHPMDMLPAQMPYQALTDGQRFQLGQLTIETIWFPGHTLGQVNFLVTAPDQSTYLFTGDGLFLESFGRPDLGGKGETWTPVLYQSLFQRLPAMINDQTWILPSHISHLDEGDGEGRFFAPYGQVRRNNAAMQHGTREDFITFVLNNLPVFPPQYIEIKRVNLGLFIPDEEKASELEIGKTSVP